MKKRNWLSAILTAVMLVSMLACFVLPAAAATSGTTGDCTWSLNGTVLTISGNGEMDNYSYNEAPWGREITVLIIEEGVISIGDYSFPYCGDLIKIVIPSTLQKTSSTAFYSFDAMEEFMARPNVYISDLTAWCNIDFGLNFGNPLCWGGKLYLNQKLVEDLEIPEEITSIGDCTFENCLSLTSVTIPERVTVIGEDAFYGCTNLKDVYISDIASWCKIDGLSNLLYYGADLYIEGVLITDLVIPNGVTSIQNSAFYGCTSLKSVAIPDSVTTIGDRAFRNCTSLTSITIPDSVTTIGDYAFRGCTNLTSVTILDGVTTIGEYAFEECSSLTSIVIPESITSIGKHAFYNCRSLQEISIPSSVSKIEVGTFASAGLKRVYLPASVLYIKNGAFSGTNLKRVFYGGGEEQFSALGIVKNNDPLTGAKWTYNESRLGEHVYSNACDAFCDECTMSRIPADHVYDDICDTTCNVCEDIRTITHTYSSNCDKECNVCGYKRHTYYSHTYSNACDTICNLCEEIRTITHTYSNNCDTDCNICGNIRTVPGHVYSNDCDVECNSCGDTRLVPDHIYDHNCDTRCNVCNAYRPITHTYDHACDFDCNICGEIRMVPDHIYDHACDAACNICGAERTITHIYENTCDTTCGVCGAIRSITHSFGDYVYNNDATYEKDGTKTRICSVCGQEDSIVAVGTMLQKPVNPFGDVNETAYYYAPVLWAVEKGVTGGTSATTFSPSNTCSRAQIVTFLWRAAGCPEPTSSAMPFIDVPANAYYYKAVLWAVENGITGGTSATTFSPANPCTRAQIVTFLWRANGKPAATSANSFSDVQSGAYYYDAVLWAVEKGITTGTSSTTFAPANSCNRAQCVTFLYRCYN